jgi:hypothetical protein
MFNGNFFALFQGSYLYDCEGNSHLDCVSGVSHGLFQDIIQRDFKMQFNESFIKQLVIAIHKSHRQLTISCLSLALECQSIQRKIRTVIGNIPEGCWKIYQKNSIQCFSLHQGTLNTRLTRLEK